MTVKNNKTLWGTAIHEAGHAVTRYLLMGNIDTIESIDLVPEGNALGHNVENANLLTDEMYDAKMESFDIDKSLERGGYFFNQCCFAISGAIAQKVILGLDSIPWGGAESDLINFDSKMSMVVGIQGEALDPIIDAAIPETESLIKNNIELIERVAAAVISAKGHRLDNASLLAVLKQ